MPGDPKERRAHALRCCELAHAVRTEDVRHICSISRGLGTSSSSSWKLTHALLNALDAMEAEQEFPKQEAG